MSFPTDVPRDDWYANQAKQFTDWTKNLSDAVQGGIQDGTQAVQTLTSGMQQGAQQFSDWVQQKGNPIDYANSIDSLGTGRDGEAAPQLTLTPGGQISTPTTPQGNVDDLTPTLASPTVSPPQQIVPPTQASATNPMGLGDPNLVPNQFGDATLSTSEAYAACGPAAAIAFARVAGRNPTLREAMDLAKQRGDWTQAGMNGPNSEVDLIKNLSGASAHLGTATSDAIGSSLQQGNPVVISTPGHYFVIDGQQQQKGGDTLYHVGNSGTAYKVGKPWMTLSEMQGLGGEIQGAIYADNPLTGPAPDHRQNASLDTLNLPARPVTTGQQNVARYQPEILQAAKDTGVPASVIGGIMMTENSSANATSPAGAKGPMQVMPFHFGENEDPFDIQTNVTAGAKVLRAAYLKYHDWGKAAAAYFGAIDSKGNITTAKDAGGMDGVTYVQRFNSNMDSLLGSGTGAGPVDMATSSSGHVTDDNGTTVVTQEPQSPVDQFKNWVSQKGTPLDPVNQAVTDLFQGFKDAGHDLSNLWNTTSSFINASSGGTEGPAIPRPPNPADQMPKTSELVAKANDKIMNMLPSTKFGDYLAGSDQISNEYAQLGGPQIEKQIQTRQLQDEQQGVDINSDPELTTMFQQLQGIQQQIVQGKNFQDAVMTAADRNPDKATYEAVTNLSTGALAAAITPEGAPAAARVVATALDPLGQGPATVSKGIEATTDTRTVVQQELSNFFRRALGMPEEVAQDTAQKAAPQVSALAADASDRARQAAIRRYASRLPEEQGATGGIKPVAEGAQEEGEPAVGGETTGRPLNSAGPQVDNQNRSTVQEPASPFYLQSENLIQNKMGNRMQPAALRQMLLNNGVKAEELKWTGLDDFISQAKGPLSKQDVLDTLSKNRDFVIPNEIVKGGTARGPMQWEQTSENIWKVPDTSWQIVDSGNDGPRRYQLFDGTRNVAQFPTLADAADAADGMAPEFGNPSATSTQYEGYKLPGGENYREWLFQQNTPARTGPFKWTHTEGTPDLGTEGYHWYNSDSNGMAYDVSPETRRVGETQYERTGRYMLHDMRPGHGEHLGTYDTAEEAMQAAEQGRPPEWHTMGSEDRPYYEVYPDRQNVEDSPEGFLRVYSQDTGRGPLWVLENPTTGERFSNAHSTETAFATPEEAMQFADQHLVNNPTYFSQTPTNEVRYQSPHWDEPNVLYHVRTTDRSTAEGEPVLHIEEIQSDWHQAGRKYGYQPLESEGPARPQISVQDLQWHGDGPPGSDGGYYDAGPGGRYQIIPPSDLSDRFAYGDGEEEWGSADTLEQAVEKLNHDIQVNQPNAFGDEMAGGESYSPKPTEAPFQKTWTQQAFQRMIRQAAQEGKEGITWTTGAQQNARYSLSQVASGLRYNPDLNELEMQSTSGGRWRNVAYDATPGKLSDYVGQEVAKKLQDAPRDEDGWSEISGQDMEVGGSGMKGFYDKILPDMAAKLGKKYGVQPGMVEVPTSGGVQAGYRWEDTGGGRLEAAFGTAGAPNDIQAIISPGDHPMVTSAGNPNSDNWVVDFRGSNRQWQPVQGFDNLDDAKSYADDLIKQELQPKTEEVHYLPLTDKMRSDALSRGYPLFSGVAGGTAGAQYQDPNANDDQQTAMLKKLGMIGLGAAVGIGALRASSLGRILANPAMAAKYEVYAGRYGSVLPNGQQVRMMNSAIRKILAPAAQIDKSIPAMAQAELDNMIKAGANPAQIARYFQGLRATAGTQGAHFATPLDWFKALRTGALAGGLRTVGHIAINVPQTVLWNVPRELTTAATTGHAYQIPGIVSGVWNGLTQAGENAAQILRYGTTMDRALSGGSQLELGLHLNNTPGQWIAGALTAPMRTHSALQEFPYQIGFFIQANKLAADDALAAGLVPGSRAWGYHTSSFIQNLVGNPDALKLADQTGRRWALRGDYAAFGQALQRIQDVPYAGNILLPFVRIAYNVMTQGVERTPLGLLGTGIDVARGAYRSGTPQGVTPLAERLGNNLMGTALFALALKEAADGNVTGAGPADPDQRRTLEANGWQQESIRIGGKYYGGHILGPLWYPMGLAANLVEAHAYAKPSQPPENEVIDTMHRALAFFGNETFMQGFGSIYNMIKNGGTVPELASAVADLAKSFIPEGALVGQLSEAVDPYRRYVAPGDLAGYIKEGTPLRAQLQPEVNPVTGTQEENPRGGLGVLLPGSIESPHSPALNEMMRLGVGTTRAPTSHNNVPLTPQEGQLAESAAGPLIEKAVDRLMANAHYKHYTNEQKIAAIRDAISQARQYGEGQVVAKLPKNEVRSRMAQAAADKQLPSLIPLSERNPL